MDNPLDVQAAPSSFFSSVIDAIRRGVWDFEPAETDHDDFPATDALPGTEAKIAILAARLESGLPLWHPEDRITVLKDADLQAS